MVGMGSTGSRSCCSSFGVSALGHQCSMMCVQVRGLRFRVLGFRVQFSFRFRIMGR